MNFNWSFFWSTFPALVIKGLPITLSLSLFTMLFSSVLGLILFFTQSRSGLILKYIVNLYLSFFRGTPMIVQLYLFYYFSPYFLIHVFKFSEAKVNQISPFYYALIALSLNSAAYLCEIFRSGYLKVDKNEVEAAVAFGFKKHSIFFRIIFPSMIRVCIPNLVTQFIYVIQASSLTFFISVIDLTGEAKILAQNNWNYFESFASSGIIYWGLSIILEKISKFTEKNYQQFPRRKWSMILKVKNINKSFGGKKILKNVSLNVEKGDIVTILGPSGSGKTTFLRCLDYLEKPDDGFIILKDKNINMKDPKKKDIQFIHHHISFVFQSHNLFSHRTALENVAEGMIYGRNVKKDEAFFTAKKMLEKVGLEEHFNKIPSQLSGGQQQRVGIARALAVKPDLILLDEPTSALDPELVREVLDILVSLAKEKTTMILVTHELSFAKRVANKVVFFDQGNILEEGSPVDIFKNPQHKRTKEFIDKISYK